MTAMMRLPLVALLLGLAACDTCPDTASCPAAGAVPPDEVSLLQLQQARVEQSAHPHSHGDGPGDDHGDSHGDGSAHAARQASDPDPTDFADMGCMKSVPFDEKSVWKPGYSRRWHSCSASSAGNFATGKDVRPDGASMCASAAGVPDYTSIFVDMESLADPTGCFAWVTEDCAFDMRRVQKIEFDLDVSKCEALWASPIWMSPLQWIAPQGLSGEVDFVEMCPVPSLSTNLGCYSLQNRGPAFCRDGMHGHWGNAGGLATPKHMVMSIKESDKLDGLGDLDVNVCEMDGTKCKLAAHYANYMGSIHPTKGKKVGAPFEFRSDVWNGYKNPKDGGWEGCKAVRNTQTKCKYAIANIRITSSDGKPFFANGKCAAFNAATDR